MGKPRELIEELIGEEDTARYFEGLSIEVTGKSATYTIERKRGYADIVRTRKLRRDTYSNHGSFYLGVDGIMQTVSRQPETDGEYRIHTDSGRLRAWNIDDAVASFIVSAKAGKVNWGCGNIDVRLPSTMPPKNLSPLTFIVRGIQTIAYYLQAFPSKYIEFTRSGDLFPLLMGSILIPWAIAIATLASLPDAVYPINGYIAYPILFYPLYMGAWIGYTRWRSQWEVKMS